jgi:hypothetical protein
VSFLFCSIVLQIFMQWLLGTKYVRGQHNLVDGMVCTSVNGYICSTFSFSELIDTLLSFLYLHLFLSVIVHVILDHFIFWVYMMLLSGEP